RRLPPRSPPRTPTHPLRRTPPPRTRPPRRRPLRRRRRTRRPRPRSDPPARLIGRDQDDGPPALTGVAARRPCRRGSGMLHCLPAAPVAGAPARTCGASRSAPGALSGPTGLWWSGRFARRQCPAGVLSICIATVWHRLVRVGRQRRGGRSGLLRVIFG